VGHGSVGYTEGTDDNIGVDDVAGVKFQRVKVILGAEGVDGGDLSATNPLPVSGPLTDTQLRASAVLVTGTFFQATQPVSAAALPLPAGAAQEHITAAAPHAVRLTDGGAFYKPTTPSDTQPVSIAALPALAAGAATIGKVDQGAPGASGWKVDGSAVTQPVSSSTLALDATLTGGTAKSIARGGAKGATTAADVTSTAQGTDHQGLDVIHRDASGNAMPSGDALGRPIFVRPGDGTNATPAMDAVGRPGFVKVTDGTNTLPTMDAAARKGFVQGTDGTNSQSYNSDGSALVTQAKGAPTVTSVNHSATNVTLLSANSSRKNVLIYNDSTTATVSIKLGATASATSFTTKIGPGEYWEHPMPITQGQIDCISDVASGALRVTEVA
jgi:hypothetical protein